MFTVWFHHYHQTDGSNHWQLSLKKWQEWCGVNDVKIIQDSTYYQECRTPALMKWRWYEHTSDDLLMVDSDTMPCPKLKLRHLKAIFNKTSYFSVTECQHFLLYHQKCRKFFLDSHDYPWTDAVAFIRNNIHTQRIARQISTGRIGSSEVAFNQLVTNTMVNNVSRKYCWSGNGPEPDYDDIEDFAHILHMGGDRKHERMLGGENWKYV